MRGGKGLLHDLGILTAGQIAAQLMNVWALVYLAGYLGPHWFGVVQIGVALMAYALIVAEWGMINLGIRDVARQDSPREIHAYACTHTGMMLLQACVVLVLGVLLLPGLPFTAQDPVVFILYLAAVIPQVFLQSWIAVGMERMTWVGVAKTARSLIYALMILALLRPLDGVCGLAARRWVPLLLLAAMILGNLAVVLPVTRWLGGPVLPRLPAAAEMARRWRQAGPIGANTVVLRVLLNIDLIMLGVLATPAAAGNYAAAARVIFFLVVAIEVLWAALLPRLARLARQSRPAFAAAFNTALGWVAALLLPVACGGFLLGGDLVRFLYGQEYPEAGPVFQVLSVSYAMLAIATFLGNALLAEDRQHAYFPPLAAAAGAAVAGAAWLIPLRGGLGAAWSMLFSHGLLLVWLIALYRRLFSRLLLETTAALLPPLILMALVVRALSEAQVLLRVAAGAGVYSAAAAYPILRFQRRSRGPR